MQIMMCVQTKKITITIMDEAGGGAINNQSYPKSNDRGVHTFFNKHQQICCKPPLVLKPFSNVSPSNHQK